MFLCFFGVKAALGLCFFRVKFKLNLYFFGVEGFLGSD